VTKNIDSVEIAVIELNEELYNSSEFPFWMFTSQRI
jgi:hypothetical protein